MRRHGLGAALARCGGRLVLDLRRRRLLGFERDAPFGGNGVLVDLILRHWLIRYRSVTRLPPD